MWADFKAWAKSPFQADMDALHWFLFLGLLIMLLAGWRMVLVTLTREL